jgi:hypothetical protein
MSYHLGNWGPANIQTEVVLARSRYIQDNFEDVISTQSNLAKFFLMNDRNAQFREAIGRTPRKKPFFTGPQIEVPLKYALGNIQWIYGNTPLNTTRYEYATLGKYEWKEVVSPPMTLSRRQLTLNRGSQTRIMDIVRTDMEAAMDSVVEGLETAMAGSAAGFSILGLQNLVEDSPTSTIGGIDRSTYSFFRNQVDTTAIGNFGSSNAGYRAMEAMWSLTERGSETCDVIFTTSDIQRYFKQYLVENGTWNTFEHPDMGKDLGITVPWFHGAPVAQSAGIAANHMYFLNTDTIFLVMYEGEDFVETGAVQGYGKLEEVNYIYAMMSFITTNPARNGVITSITGY